MKNIKNLFVLVIILIIVIPLLNFNFQGNYASSIDNRYLTEFPLSSPQEDMTMEIENYVNDRIGYRDESITGYTKLNDALFHKMEHPSYEYGKDGYVFFKYGPSEYDYEWIDIYVDFIADMQNYCNERNVPFLYVLDPSKTTVYSQFLSDGYNLDHDRIEYLLKKLDQKKINYVDNTPLLIEKSKNEQVFNRQYDAGHWNDLGAFYGINNILSSLKKNNPDIELNEKDDFDISESTATSLPVSKFDINENVPVFNYKDNINYGFQRLNNKYMTLKLNNNYKTFNYNYNKNANNSLKAMFFQGSYLNTRATYLWKSFKECINIHAYQNVINFDYYFNIFQPDIVVFESAEYATSAVFYSTENMINKTLNPVLNSEKAEKVNEEINVERNGNIASITVDMDKVKNAYITMRGKTFDLLWNDETKQYYADIDQSNFSDKYDIYINK